MFSATVVFPTPPLAAQTATTALCQPWVAITCAASGASWGI